MVGEGATPLKEVEAKLIEYCLSRGYLPAQLTSKVIKANASYKGYPVMSYVSFVEAKDYAVAECYSAYAGKKTAREIYQKNGVIELPTKVYLTPHLSEENKK